MRSIIKRDYLLPKDMKKIKNKIEKEELKYKKKIQNINNYDKYILLYGNKSNGILSDFIKIHWGILDKKFPEWSYIFIYIEAKKYIKECNKMKIPIKNDFKINTLIYDYWKINNEYKLICQESAAIEYFCYQTIKSLKIWFKKKKIDIEYYDNNLDKLD